MIKSALSWRPAIALAAALAFLPALPLLALNFPELLSRFKELSLPTALDLKVWQRSGSASPSIALEDLEAFVLVPARSLAASRPGLRGLWSWENWIRDYRRYQSNRTGPDEKRLAFKPLGRLSSKGYVVLAVVFYAEDWWVNGSRSWENGYLLSYSTAGRLIDGMPFYPSQNWRETIPEAWPDLPPGRYPQDLTCHQGYPDSVSIAFDTTKRIVALDRYGVDRTIFEIGQRELGISAEGAFAEIHPKHRFLLSRVFGEAEGSSGRLHVYEAEDGGEGEPPYFIWIGGSEGSSFEARATAGLSPKAVLSAVSVSGKAITVELSADLGRATLVDAAGARHELGLRLGPGDRGEKTSLSGILTLGDADERRSRTWTYLFTPALLPVAGPGGQELFATHSWVLGAMEDGEEGSRGDVVSIGTLAKESRASLGETPVFFAPGGVRDFEHGLVAGALAREFKIQSKVGGAAALPAGTRVRILDAGGPNWLAVPSKDCSVVIKDLKLKVPAGSSLEFYLGGYAIGLAFSSPLPIRLSGATVPVYDLGIQYSDFFSKAYWISAAEIADPIPVSAGGAKIELIDEIRFDGKGNESGRLQADAEIKVGARSLSFRGGYDPEDSETGRISIYPDGRLRSGYLAAQSVFQSGKGTVRLREGDEATFGPDGNLESCKPRAMVRLSSGDRSAILKCYSLEFKPDGSLVSENLPEELQSASGNFSVYPLFATCIDMNVRVRTVPGLQTKTLGHLNEGDRVLVMERSPYAWPIAGNTDYWYRIRRASDGLAGWSFGSFLKLEQ